MKKKVVFIFLGIFLFLLNKLSFAEDFYFEGDEIEIINNGEILKSNKGVQITSSSGVVITAQEFEYNKKNLELSVNKNVLVNDKINNLIIKTNILKYSKNIEQIQTFEDTEIEIEKLNKFFLCDYHRSKINLGFGKGNNKNYERVLNPSKNDFFLISWSRTSDL